MSYGTNRLKGTLMLCLIAGLILLTLLPADATESGGSAYPNGAVDFMCGAAPPPGTYFIDYFNYYSAAGFRNNNGNNAYPKFSVNVAANVFQFIRMTQETFLGGTWGMHVFIPVLHMDSEVPGANGHRTGMGDIIIDPFLLSWHWPNFHLVTGMDLYVPVGSFGSNPLTPLGRNYWTFEPLVAGTYLTDSGFQVSVKLMYDFNTLNMDTDYRSGQELHLDYVVGQKVKNFDLGIGGYYYQQTTADSAPFGQTANGKGMTVSVGPVIKYDYRNMSFILKYYYELESYNRPQGSSFWAKFIYSF